MIVSMQKITLVVLASERENALSALRGLGVMHIAVSGKLADSASRAAATAELAQLERIETLLGSMLDRKVRGTAGSLSPAQVEEKVQSLLNAKEQCARELDAAERRIEQLTPWGEFNPSEIARMREQGVFVYCCEAPRAEMEKLELDDAVVKLVSRRGDNVAFAVVSRREIKEKLPLAQLPAGGRLSAAHTARRAAAARLLEIDEELKVIAASDLALLRAHKNSLVSALEFATARDAMSECGAVDTLEGFVPDDRMAEFDDAAKKNGWAYLANPADPEHEAVPTLVRMPKWVRIVNPLFDFLGIAPGYTEVDASPVVLIFFTVFFGILVGDAAYGTLFLAISFPATLLLRGKARLATGFITLLSCSAILWGVLTNNYFGCRIPALDFLECRALASSADKDANVQYLCFTLGLVQLAIGHFWRMLRDGRWRNVGSQLGWLAMMTANFFLIRTMIVYPTTTSYPPFLLYCYGSGIALVAVCEVNWLDPGSVLGFPFSLINSFVDLLSYIRLFAVGMSSYYLAYSFNGIASDMMATPAGVAAGIVVLLVGHLLNIGLAVLAVLVHGVRLNTLEFSSHIGLQWSGFAFKPFAGHEK